MPPKKEEEPAIPIVVWTILPVFLNCKKAEQALKKPVSIKKTLDRSKLIQLLKDKGIEQYQTQGQLNRQGQLFLCQNLQSVSQQYLAQSRKPADPKKDAKKDSKKDTKKEQVVEETEKPLEFDFEKAITEFLFFLDLPLDSEALKVSTEKGLKLNVVVWIQEKVKEGSQLPSYDILNNQRTIEDFMKEMNTTSPEKINRQQETQDLSREEKEKKSILKSIQTLRMAKDSPLENTIIINVPFEKDLQHPEHDTEEFLKNLFKRLCELTLRKERFSKWVENQKKQPMIPPLKETIKKEVVVEEKKDQKKGGKKDPNAQPVTEIVEEIIEKRYESFPQNIKSDLVLYNKISKQRNKEANSSRYYNVLDDLALSISSVSESAPKINYNLLGKAVWSQSKTKPLSKIEVNHLKTRLPLVLPSQNSSELSYTIKLSPNALPSEVSLSAMLKRHPDKKSLQHEYKIEQFTDLSNKLGDRIYYTFDQRKYVEKLDPKILNSRINQQLQHDPKIYYGNCIDDGYSLLILARINPPGRVMYFNHFFQWKVLPNFQFWEETFKNVEEGKEFWDYNWRQTGNLKILSKKMMPTDNTVISENLFTYGDCQNRLITLSKDNALYGFHQLQGGNHLFWKKQEEIKTSIYTKNIQRQEKVNIETCIQGKQFLVLFDPLPTIYWKNHSLQESRVFGPKGQVTKRMKDGTVEVLYPNGDISILHFGRWKHIKNNKELIQGSLEKELKMDYKVDTDKKIVARQDSTIFVVYPNKDRSIIFKDGTIVRKMENNKIVIKNPENFVVRINLARQKDFNVIGSGSAFAYLGFSNLLQRTYDGYLYELCHPSFSWHTYTEGVDRSGNVNQEKVMIIAYPDNSVIKLGNEGQLTFLNQTSQKKEEYMNQRWIQLFTAAQYHLEGVYDVDMIRGQITTKDAESNCFKVKVDGTGKTKIAVSFNIGGVKQEKNDFGEGLHVPDQNYFLPPPQNCITPRLFVIYPDGRGTSLSMKGEQYLTEEQISDIKGWREVKEAIGNEKIVQYSREAVPPSAYFSLSFSEKIDPSWFTQPNLIEEASTHLNNISYSYSSIYFRSLEELEWERDFSRIKTIRESILSKRKEVNEERESLKRNRIKA